MWKVAADKKRGSSEGGELNWTEKHEKGGVQLGEKGTAKSWKISVKIWSF